MDWMAIFAISMGCLLSPCLMVSAGVIIRCTYKKSQSTRPDPKRNYPYDVGSLKPHLLNMVIC